MDFLEFVDHEKAKLALILNLIEPKCGGLLLIGPKGTGKSTLLKAFKSIVKAFHVPFIELPLNATEEALLGGINIEKSVKDGKKIFQRGIISRANNGFLVIEDINLFPLQLLSLVFEAQSRSEIVIEREGFALRELSSFQILATMNSEEGELSSHFLDRFGLCVAMNTIIDKDLREDIIKVNIRRDSKNISQEELIQKIRKSKEIIKSVKVSDYVQNLISEQILKEAVESHRADIFLYHTSRAYAAFLSEGTVREQHIKDMIPFVTFHRKRYILPQEEREQNERHEDKSGENKEENFENSKRNENRGKSHESSNFSTDNIESQEFQTFKRQEVFSIGQAFKVKRFFFKRDRIKRQKSGSRTKTKTKGRGGRYIRSIFSKTPEIALDATLRAAAPFQKIRGRKDRVVILEEDLRYKEKERKMGLNVIFLVDGSGSMGVRQRMIEVKGAILSLLIDSYHKRDRVAMIVFRKDKAETVLPLTSSVELAMKRLREIPTGGKTPLTKGLFEAFKFIRRLKLKEPHARFLLFILTDGKANVSISGKPIFEEIKMVCNFLRQLTLTDIVVIDTEKKTNIIKMDLALRLARMLNSDYVLMDELKTDSITKLVNLYKNSQESGHININ